MKLAIAVAAVLLALSPASAKGVGRCGDHLWCDTNLSPDARAALLLAELTNDERVALLGGDDLQGVLGADGTHTGTSDGVPRLDLPTVYYTDGPVGVRSGQATAMPVPMGLAATFDTKLARLHGTTIATEARAKGNDVVYAPTVNILRTPLWGRAFETFGEDPYLSGRIGVGWIRGAQSTGVIGNVKHYAANNQEGAGAQADESRPGQPVGPPATEGNRLTVNVVVDERALREIYLPQFEMAVRDANVGSVMCAYPRVNGAYACENGVLLQDILRDDWGFKGYVLADYGAAKTTAPSLNNGLDFDPWPGISYNPANVNAAVMSGQVDFERVNEHVRAILRTLFAYGFFDREAYVYDDNQIDKEANLRSAQQIEEAAITLLRNKRKALPLKASKLESIALIGRNADEFTTGGGSANVRPFEFQSPRAAIEERAGEGVDVRFDDGSDPERAAALAEASDVAIVFAADYQTEFIDRRCLSLQCPPWNGDQDALIETVADANDRTVVVLETGGPVLTPWRGKVAAILEAWYPGSGGGPALARVLFGDVDPGGRLPATFPRSEEDYPYHGDTEAYPGVAEQVEYKEGVFVGYRWFDTEGLRPAYPFGFGLSYTKFRYDKLRIRRRGQDAATVSFTVRNVGRRAGIEVPQLYLGLPSTAVKQPPVQLKDFRKLTLEPGQRKRVRFRIDPRDISYWNVDADGWRIARGCYQVVIGRSSRRVALIAEESFRGGRCG
ncbi:MAG: beta-glucosidase family protein [Thermoleophilaceae bacterium]